MQLEISALARRPLHQPGRAAVNQTAGLEVDPNPPKARSFFGRAWDCFTNCLTRPKRGAAISVAARAPSKKSRSPSLATLEKSCKAHSDGLYGWYFGTDLHRASEDARSLWQNYCVEHKSLRDAKLNNPQFCETHKDAALETKFINAEIAVHDLLVRTGKYPKYFLSRVEPLVANLAGRLESGFGVAVEKKAPHWNTADREILRYASGCYAKMKAAVQKDAKDIQPRLTPADEAKYCDMFHKIYMRLRHGIPERHFSNLLTKLAAHDIALTATLRSLSGSSTDASSHGDKEQIPKWEKKMAGAALEYMAISWDVHDAYDRKVFGNTGRNAMKWTEKEKEVWRAVLTESMCNGISWNGIELTRRQHADTFPAGITVEDGKRLNAAYDGIHHEIRSELLRQNEIEDQDSDVATRFHLADALAHKLIDEKNAPELPKEYLAWKKMVADANAPLLAMRLFISSAPDPAFHL